MEEINKSGYLIVKVSTASGAIPVEGVTVLIQGKEDENKRIFISRLTDVDGSTEKITLPAPERSLSVAPSPSSKPYFNYNIEVYKDGFYPQHYNGVPIFEGITAIQNARIIPIAEFDAQTPYYSPGQVFDEYENPNL